MNANRPRTALSIKRLLFTGLARSAELTFAPGLNLVYGASNTGKSFSVKAIDFLLGSSRPLPDIGEKRGFERASLGLSLPKVGDVTLVRALAGGAFDLYQGDIVRPQDEPLMRPRQLSARHDHTKTDNLSQFLLDELGFAGKEVAVDINGKKRSLSFRDLVPFCIVDEISIQSNLSPVESGQYQDRTVEHSVFKLLVTGQDDSAITPVLDRKTFKTTTTAKLQIVDELILENDEKLRADFPEFEALPDQSDKLEHSLAEVQRDFHRTRQSIRSLLDEQSRVATDLSRTEARRAEIQINLGRFSQLADVYNSDIERLQSIEEAGFLLALGGDKDCPLCGAPPDVQRHVHSLDEIERARDAANAEIEKIEALRTDLDLTIKQLTLESYTIGLKLEGLNSELSEIEDKLAQLAPETDLVKNRLQELLAVRDRVKRGLELLDYRRALIARRDELAALKPAGKADRPDLSVPGPTVHDFAQTVSRVLEEWQFPGQRDVTFDDAAFDLRIDGKLRGDNGKGIRAVTHSAFKVALLLFCHERNLPHPGFLILDTPLLTYRDPLHSKEGPLSDDEKVLRNTSLKDFFFEHLSRIGDVGQFIVIENVDLPPGIEKLAHMETFTADPAAGRTGLFPTATR